MCQLSKKQKKKQKNKNNSKNSNCVERAQYAFLDHSKTFGFSVVIFKCSRARSIRTYSSSALKNYMEPP